MKLPAFRYESPATLAEAVRLLADGAGAAKALAGGQGIVNLGNPANAISVLDLAHRIKRLTGSASPIVHVDGKTIHGELYEEAASVDKLPVLDAAAAAGWRPEVGLDELILQTIAFYRSHRDMCADEAA